MARKPGSPTIGLDTRSRSLFNNRRTERVRVVLPLPRARSVTGPATAFQHWPSPTLRIGRHEGTESFLRRWAPEGPSTAADAVDELEYVYGADGSPGLCRYETKQEDLDLHQAF
jgi:hypothetical protein